MRTPIPNGVIDDDASFESVDVLTDLQRAPLPDTPQVEEALWEDEPEYNLAKPKQESPAPAFAQKSVRKRKSGGKKIFLAQPSPSIRKFTPKTKGNISEDVPPLVNVDRARVQQGIQDGVAFTWDYVYDVTNVALRLLRKPLGLLLFAYIFAFLVTQVSSAFRTAFAPICWIPIISSSALCYTAPPSPNVPQWADYPKLVEVESSTLEKLLDESVANVGLSLDIKRTEMATSDLVTLVKASNLQSKDTLAEHLQHFVEDSRKTGRALQKLNSRVSGAIDGVTAVNEHALRTIEGAQAAKSSLGSISSLILWPISKSVSTQTIIANTFGEAMSMLETQLSRVRIEAEAAAIYLNNLDQSLTTIHELLTRDNIILSKEREEMMSEIWTALRAALVGDPKKLKAVKGDLRLLGHVGNWRKDAQMYVLATLHALDGMSEDMEDLRERVASPELLGESIPPEVHIRSIQAGLERLKMDRNRAKEREDENLRRVLGEHGVED